MNFKFANTWIISSIDVVLWTGKVLRIKLLLLLLLVLVLFSKEIMFCCKVSLFRLPNHDEQCIVSVTMVFWMVLMQCTKNTKFVINLLVAVLILSMIILNSLPNPFIKESKYQRIKWGFDLERPKNLLMQNLSLLYYSIRYKAFLKNIP